MAIRIWYVFFLVICALATNTGDAAELRYSAEVTDVFRPDWTPFEPGAAPGTDTTHGIPLIAKVDLFFEIDQFLPGEIGFGNMAFDVFRYGDVQYIAPPVWVPDGSTIDSNGADFGGLRPKWDDNMDIGPSGTDLKSVLVGIHPKTLGPEGVDPRRMLGQHGPEYFGSLFIPWDGRTLFQTYIHPEGFDTYSSELLFNINSSLGVGHGVGVNFGRATLPFSVLDWDVRQWRHETGNVNSYTIDDIGVDIAFSNGANNPRVAGFGFGEHHLFLSVRLEDTSHQARSDIHFSSPVTDVEFAISEINAANSPPGFPGEIHQDIVSVVGFLDGQEVLPTLVGAHVLAVNENTVMAFPPSETGWGVQGSMEVRFDQPIDQILILIGTDTASLQRPTGQRFLVSDVLFSPVVPDNVPEPASALILFLGMIAIAGISNRRVVRSRVVLTESEKRFRS